MKEALRWAEEEAELPAHLLRADLHAGMDWYADSFCNYRMVFRKGEQMYYIGYIAGIIFIIWLISKIFGKKGNGTDSGINPGEKTTVKGIGPVSPGMEKPAKTPDGDDGTSAVHSGDGDPGRDEPHLPETTDGAEKTSSIKTGKRSGVRSGRDESEAPVEKKMVILYRENTGKSRGRCPYCNTYISSGNTVCEVCGSRISA